MHTRKLILAATFGLLLAGCSQTYTTTNAEVIPPEYPVDYFFKTAKFLAIKSLLLVTTSL